MNQKDYLFEISYEVCQKIGGINTVVASKAKFTQNFFENYFLIGPFVENNQEFIEEKIPENLEDVFLELKNLGIEVFYGFWDIVGKPKTLLVNSINFSKNTNKIKSLLWEKYKIDSLNSNWYDFDSVMLWSWCCGIVIEKISNKLNPFNDSKTFIQAHEWIAGSSILYIKSLEDDFSKNKFKTIFTTHATMLGRAVTGNFENIYDLENKNIDFLQKAYQLGVQTKFLTEKVLANNSDCFTTVSDITAKESEIILGKKPDVILNNGFDNLNKGFLENQMQEFYESRNLINDFLKRYFKPFYEIDLDKNSIFYTSGRFEFYSKGFDLLIDSLSKLNKSLKEKNSLKEVIFLFLVPLGEFELSEHLRDENFSSKNSNLLDVAPLSTHNISTQNQIIANFIEKGLLNKFEDKVKVILIPEYLSLNDKILQKNYYDYIKGFDLGIFPSFYEPWGYTPLESIAFGVETITSNLTGFGESVLKNFPNSDFGLEILDRRNLNFEELSNSLKEKQEKFLLKNKKRLCFDKELCFEFAKNFSWRFFIKNYLRAYEFARNSK